jgi:PKD repeat protein
MALKNYTKYSGLMIILTYLIYSCYKEETVDLASDFEFTVEGEDYSVPVEISLENKSRGADRYEWAFEGGIPATSTAKQPDNVWYKNAGEYRIKLTCWYKDRPEAKEVILQLDSAIQISFDTQILVNPIAPVEVAIDNQSFGSSYYQWTFEGGIPEQSGERYPPVIRYENPGEYAIRLEISNGREKQETTRTIRVLPRMENDFTVEFSFEDEDMQAPAVVYLKNRCIGVLSYKWEVPGGTIGNDTASSTSVYFEHPGKYEITLQTGNDKESKTVKKSVEVFSNTNLLSMENIRLGVNSSDKYGMFFSGYFRKAFTGEEIEEDETLGRQVDIIFFGLNSRFTYCRFLSPDSADLFTFRPVPGVIFST